MTALGVFRFVWNDAFRCICSVQGKDFRCAGSAEAVITHVTAALHKPSFRAQRSGVAESIGLWILRLRFAPRRMTFWVFFVPHGITFWMCFASRRVTAFGVFRSEWRGSVLFVRGGLPPSLVLEFFSEDKTLVHSRPYTSKSLPSLTRYPFVSPSLPGLTR